MRDKPTLGVTFRPQLPPERLREVAQAADAAGVAELWLWEDCFLEGGLTAASAALAWTERLRVGVGLLPVPLRNPALAAMEIATVGPAVPGPAACPASGTACWTGWPRSARASSRRWGCCASTRRCATCCTAGRSTTAGRYVQLDGVALDWPPAEVPPVLVGARGRRRCGWPASWPTG